MISDFIAATCSEPFEWGQNDCALWCASAVLHMTGFDPASDLRGQYVTAFQCRQIVMAAGGLEPLIAPRMKHPALRKMAGDGVAVLRVGKLSMCGLVLEGRAVLKTQRGLKMEDDFTVLRGWSW